MLLMGSPQSRRDSDAETLPGRIHAESRKFILHLVDGAGKCIGISVAGFNGLDAERRPELRGRALLYNQIRPRAAQHGTMDITAARWFFQIPCCFYFDFKPAQLIR